MRNGQRLNPGLPGDLPVLFENIEFQNPESNALELWNIYDRGPKDDLTRWKLCAAPGTSVLGKANYALIIKDTHLWTKDGGGDLQAERPGLFLIIEQFAAGNTEPNNETLSEDDGVDPYGDLAISRKHALTQSQLWNRALLEMRKHELHWECRPDKDNLPEGVVRAKSWELGVRQAWFGIFRDNWDKAAQAHGKSIAADARKRGSLNVDTMKVTPDWNAAVLNLARHLTRDMPQEVLDDAIAFITRRGPGEISYDAYRKVLQDYYNGAYAPNNCTMLASMFDEIANVDVPLIDSRGVPLDEAVADLF